MAAAKQRLHSLSRTRRRQVLKTCEWAKTIEEESETGEVFEHLRLKLKIVPGSSRDLFTVQSATQTKTEPDVPHSHWPLGI